MRDVAVNVAMSRSSRHHMAGQPVLVRPADAERLARWEKNARLKDLRMHASWLVLDPDAPFREEIDCS